MHLYPKVIVIGQDFSGVKVVTVPNQAMTLEEIIKRFTRRESIPIEKDGVYLEGMGDLEKAAHADLTVQHERIAELRKTVARGKEREKKAKESASAGSPPSTSAAPSSPAAPSPQGVQSPPTNTGGVTGKPDVAQAP